MFDGTPLKTGATLSITVTVKLAVAGPFPAASVAVYVTVVTPTGKLAPDTKFDMKLVTPTASVAVGAVHVATAALLPDGV